MGPTAVKGGLPHRRWRHVPRYRAASAVTYLVPVVSVALGATFLSEPTGLNLLGGAVLILLGVALVQQRPPSSASPLPTSPSPSR